ncbi:hypothetical protein N7537_004484 [Penicillium hordei]|uniref:Uncharacterized protein n=1 Tax=Penicillium hordei TaxID=40994 RepID=A0AAD6EBC2_9EURO|nr:uncharacterized protein N7537_004484 [Penicillium hordei]KAJ5607865.1 hypothetical protein N7537_004484 [Penicillium hordei]
MTNIDTVEPNIKTTEYIMFSIDSTTFQQDFIGPDAISIHLIRTSFNPKTELLSVKMVTREHSERLRRPQSH